MSESQTRRFIGRRLVYFSRHADESLWHGRWANRLAGGFYKSALEGRFKYLGALYERYLPRDGLIVEAGCGRAEITVALAQRGYAVEGVDYDAKTVEILKQQFPELNLRVADVTALPVPDAHYAAYISIGVIEHREAGPEPFLDEAIRVLRPGGIAIFTVPYINPIRRWKARRGDFDGSRPEGLPFYQYAFDECESRAYLEAAGFEVLETQPYGGFKGITDELRWAKPILKLLRSLPWVGARFQARLDHCRYGHMLALVARRPDGSC